MLLIVGLGNPGEKYKNHRHNVGFIAVDAIANAHGFGPEKSKFSSTLREGTFETGDGPEKALILCPLTFMNESGRAVQKCAQFYKIPLERIIVFHDELDLEPGKLRMKTGGGIAGHNGLRSICQHIGAAFHRARIGIGHPGHKDRVHGYVLSDFSNTDRDWLGPLCDAITTSVPLLASGEHDKFQTRVHHLAPAPVARPERA